MQKGLITRYIIFQILKSLKNEKINYDSIFFKKIKNRKLISSDINLIQNVVLTSMRYHLEIDQIIKIYTNKINKNSNNYFLILSGIAQIVFLNFKDYAVIHSSVEIAKKVDSVANSDYTGIIIAHKPINAATYHLNSSFSQNFFNLNLNPK